MRFGHWKIAFAFYNLYDEKTFHWAGKFNGNDSIILHFNSVQFHRSIPEGLMQSEVKK